jgi:YfiH family protein
MKLTSPALDGLPHGFFTREGGVSKGLYGALNGGLGSRDEREAVLENRARMAAALGVEAARFMTPYQVHSADVITVSGPWPGEERPQADALVTATPGLAIGVSTADCGPLLFADRQAGVVGAAHAGWQGAFKGIAERTIEAMEALGANRARVTVAIGPMIRQPNYEVGPEFVARFTGQEAANAAFFTPSGKPGHALFDLPGYLVARLTRFGVAGIADLGRCTYAEPDVFYSYRRSTHRAEPDYGRHISAIALG